jgi:hypothetical protein
MAVKPNFVIFWVMTLGGYKCLREPCCPNLQDSKISNLKTEEAGFCTTLITTFSLHIVITQIIQNLKSHPSLQASSTDRGNNSKKQKQSHWTI